MEQCFACKKRIWPWQQIGFNSSWHKQCSKVWIQGYSCALDFCHKESRVHGFPTPSQLYRRRGSIGEILPKKLWRGDQSNKRGL